MIRNIKKIVPVILALFSLSSCIFFEPQIKGDGKVVSQERKLADFSEVEVSAGINVYIKQGNQYNVTVTADQNLIDIIKTKVEGNTLFITSVKSHVTGTQLKVNVVLPNLEKLKAVAGSNIFTDDTLKVNFLKVTSTAGSNIKLELKAKSLEIQSIAGSNLKISGYTEKLNAKANSGSNIYASELSADECYIRCNTGANVWISPVKSLSGISGSGGNLYYYGTPASVEVKTISGGNVIKK